VLVLLICKPTPKNKIKIKKRLNWKKKSCKGVEPCWSFRDGGSKVWVMTIKGMESRGSKRNTQIELRKTFIGRMGFIHE
jgi:hypothetical protein